MVNTHQLASVTALPCGDGELQQVNVQNAHIVYITYRHKVTQGSIHLFLPQTLFTALVLEISA